MARRIRVQRLTGPGSRHVEPQPAARRPGQQQQRPGLGLAAELAVPAVVSERGLGAGRSMECRQVLVCVHSLRCAAARFVHGATCAALQCVVLVHFTAALYIARHCCLVQLCWISVAGGWRPGLGLAGEFAVPAVVSKCGLEAAWRLERRHVLVCVRNLQGAVARLGYSGAECAARRVRCLFHGCIIKRRCCLVQMWWPGQASCAGACLLLLSAAALVN